MAPKALITGITGQDGSYLAELLLSRGYDVHGTILPDDPGIFISSIREQLTLHALPLEELSAWRTLLQQYDFSEVYHLAAQSHVGESFGAEALTMDINIKPLYYLLSVLHETGLQTRVFFAASAEVFAKKQGAVVNEQTPLEPTNPYGISKAAGLQICRFYRQAYAMHISCGILFNHESPRRGPGFVTQKVCLAFKAIREGRQEILELGNLDAERDWGYAPEYVEAMWRMLQADSGDDYVVATGQLHSLRGWVETAASLAGFDLVWQGQGLEEQGIDRNSRRVLVRVNPAFYRPDPGVSVTADPGHINRTLGWTARRSLSEIVREMM